MFICTLKRYEFSPTVLCRTVTTRTFFALGGSRFCVTPGDYAMAFCFLSVLKQSLLCLVVIFSPMLVSCCSLIVSSVVASHCCELQVYHSVIFLVEKTPQFCKYTLYRHLFFGRFIFVLRYVFSSLFL